MKFGQELKNIKKNNMHKFLEKTKNRTIVLLPPLTLCIISAFVAFIHQYSNFSPEIIHFFQYLVFISSIWLVLSVGVVLWSDYKRRQNEYK